MKAVDLTLPLGRRVYGVRGLPRDFEINNLVVDRTL